MQGAQRQNGKEEDYLGVILVHHGPMILSISQTDMRVEQVMQKQTVSTVCCSLGESRVGWQTFGSAI